MTHIKSIDLSSIKTCYKHLIISSFSLICEIFLTLLIAISISKVLDNSIHFNLSLFYKNLTLLVISIVSLSIVVGFRTYSISFISEAVTYNLRNKGTNTLLRMSKANLDKTHSGDSISRLTNDLQLVRQFLDNDFYFLIFRPVMAFASFIYLFHLNWQLTIISSIVLPILFLVSSILGKPISKYSNSLQDELSNMNSTTQDMLGGILTIKAFNLQDIIKEKFEIQASSSSNKSIKLGKQQSMLESITVVFSLLPIIVTFALGGYFAVNGIISPGNFLAFVSLLNNLTYPLSQLPHHYGSYRAAIEGYKRINALISEEQERESGSNFDTSPCKTIVEFNNVTFSYNDDIILENLSFSVKKGETIALVGHSGSGKSTLFKLISGFYDYYDGKILLFEHNLSNWSLKALRSKMAVVTQDNHLFPISILDNIKLSKPESPFDEVITIAKATNIHFFIENLESGYNTIVSENGVNMSGGQKQRIAIARALLSNSPLLLLDEATSALDTESEVYVQNAIKNAMHGRTSIVIAHRLSTILKADRILVLHDGHIVEEGNHNDLLKKKGFYYDLYKSQYVRKKGGVA